MCANLQAPNMSTIDCTLNQLASLLFDYKKRKEIEPTMSKLPAKDSKQQPTQVAQQQNGVTTCTSDDFSTECAESPSKVATNPFESPSNSMKPDASPTKTATKRDASPSKTAAKSVASPVKSAEKADASIQTTTEPAPTPTKATAATTEAAKVEVPTQTPKDATGRLLLRKRRLAQTHSKDRTQKNYFKLWKLASVLQCQEKMSRNGLQLQQSLQKEKHHHQNSPRKKNVFQDSIGRFSHGLSSKSHFMERRFILDNRPCCLFCCE